MKTLIIPAAGKSTRFNKMRPKWLLTMPDGKLMIEKCVEHLDLSNFDRVCVVVLNSHLHEYFGDGNFNNVLKNISSKAEAIYLDQPTKSQSETIVRAIEHGSIVGSIFIKDCDNSFSVEWCGGDEISIANLSEVGKTVPKNKSYVSIDHLGVVNNIIEKQIISNEFCCGGYGFSDASQFLNSFYSIKQDAEIYISHVIYNMLMNGCTFRAVKASNYQDWGTSQDYIEYTRSHITVFCDVDGVLFKNGSKYGPHGWDTEVIEENIEQLSRMQSEGKLFLVLTTSRPESEIETIVQKLSQHNLIPDRVITDLPHTRRVLINDYAATNPYPSAISINIERDATSLSEMLLYL